MFNINENVSVLVPLYLQTCERNGEPLPPFARGKILAVSPQENMYLIQFDTDYADSDWIDADRISKIT